MDEGKVKFLWELKDYKNLEKELVKLKRNNPKPEQYSPCITSPTFCAAKDHLLRFQLELYPLRCLNSKKHHYCLALCLQSATKKSNEKVRLNWKAKLTYLSNDGEGA